MQNNISPEEKLLRLIKGERQKAESVKEEKPVLQKQRFSLKDLRLIPINHFLMAVFLILGIYLVADLFVSCSGRIEQEVLSLRDLEGGVLEMPPVSVASQKPLSYYTESLQARNLFAAQDVQDTQAKATASFLEMVSKLKLQGIISGPNPQAIIEDTKTRQVYFVAPGENIGEIKLKRILPGKVKLNYYGQETELAL